MRKNLASLLYSTLNKLGLPNLLKYFPTRFVVVINFHRVNPYNDPFAESLHPDIFDGLLQFIKSNFSVTTFSELDAKNDCGKKPRIILSFDDGYFDFIEYALPVLEKYGLRCNMNLIGHSLVSGEPPFVGRVSAAFRKLSDKQLTELKIFGLGKHYSFTEGKMLFRNRVSNHLKSRSIQSREAILGKSSPWFMRALEECEFTSADRMIRIVELEGMDGHDLGSHSYSHESMGYQDEAFFHADLNNSKRLFRDAGMEHLIYAFPNGSFKEHQIEYLHAADVRHVLLVEASKSRLTLSPVATTWRRSGIHADSLSEARIKICLALVTCVAH